MPIQYLNDNGLVTLWNKIKANFYTKTQLSNAVVHNQAATISGDLTPSALAQAVSTAPQNLTDAQQAQARSNIGSDKYGVVSQTLTWNQNQNGTYTYTLSDKVYGNIPSANIDLFTSLGATFNETTGYFELNGLLDLSYEEIKTAHKMSYCTNGMWCSIGTTDPSFRTNFPLSTGYSVSGGVANSKRKQMFTMYYVYGVNNLSVIRLTQDVSKGISLSDASGYICYVANSNHVEEVQGVLNVYNLSSINLNIYFFSNAPCLKEIRLFELRYSWGVTKSPFLSSESIAFAINNNAAGTSAITITLHPTAYARAIADSDVQAALAAHTNVTLAQAS